MFRNYSFINDGSIKKSHEFCYFLNNTDFLRETRFVMQPLQHLPLCSSTIHGNLYREKRGAVVREVPAIFFAHAIRGGG